MNDSRLAELLVLAQLTIEATTSHYHGELVNILLHCAVFLVNNARSLHTQRAKARYSTKGPEANVKPV